MSAALCPAERSTGCFCHLSALQRQLLAWKGPWSQGFTTAWQQGTRRCPRPAPGPAWHVAEAKVCTAVSPGIPHRPPGPRRAGRPWLLGRLRPREPTTRHRRAQSPALQPPALQPACSAFALHVTIDTTTAAKSRESRHVGDSTGTRAAKLVSGQRGSTASSSRATMMPPVCLLSRNV